MKILITDEVHPDMPGWLTDRGHQVDWLPSISYEQLQTVIGSYQGIIVSTRIPVNRQLIDLGADLMFIARVGSGMEHIDTDYANSKGIRVVSSPEGNANAVAEHALGLLLALLRYIPRAVEQVRQHQWIREANRGLELQGRTIGIIGLGHTGSAFAGKLSGMGMRVLGYDKYRQTSQLAGVIGVPLEEIWEKAEIVSFHVPLTPETTNYLNNTFIQSMQNPFFLLNTSRGKVVHTDDLVTGLASGKVLGAALDVLENEHLRELSESEAASLKALQSYTDRVLITPHIAGWTMESKYLLSHVIVEKLGDIL